MDGVRELTPALGSAAACDALGMWRGQPGRRRDQQIRADFVGPRQRRAPARSVSEGAKDRCKCAKLSKSGGPTVE